MECKICGRPLGQESKDSGFPFCHECRKCSKCGEPLNSLECRWSIARSKEYKDQEIRVFHPGCISNVNGDDPLITIRASEFERYNMLRLAFDVDKDMGLDANVEVARINGIKLFESLSLADAIVQQAKIEKVLVELQTRALKDPSYHKKLVTDRDANLAKDRQEKAEARAKEKEKEHASRPQLPGHISIEDFMKKYKFTDQNEAGKQYTIYKKTIKDLYDSIGDMAIQMAEQAQLKGMENRLKNVSL